MTEVQDTTPVSLELPSTEFMEADGGLMLVRNPNNRAWVPLKNYYSEKEGQLLPMVGDVDYEDNQIHWQETGDFRRDSEGHHEIDQFGNKVPILEKLQKEGPMTWKEHVRVLEPVAQAEPEGGTLSFNADDSLASPADKPIL